MKLFLLWAFLLISSACSAQTIITFDRLQRMMTKQDDTLRVINFWATWCQPCVQEIPEFQKLANEEAGRPVKFIFVSLDFKKNYKTALVPFVRSHAITQEVYLLDATDYDTWIDKVDSNWGGNLPATLVVSATHGIHQFYPQEFTYETLRTALSPYVERFTH